MRIRAVTEGDAETVRELWEAFEAEVPPPQGFAPESWEEAWADLSRHANEGVALLAEDESGRAVGYAFATALQGHRSHVTDVYVRPEARRRGIARRLMHELASGLKDLGAEWVSLDVQTSNEAARSLYGRLGFEDVQAVMATSLESLRARAEPPGIEGETIGAVYVQTDDQAAVAEAVRRFLPRLYRSRTSVISAPQNGWVAVSDEAGSDDPSLLRRLAQELSHVTGAVLLSLAAEHGRVVRLAAFERGSLLDEYLSIPEAYGPLAPGDAVALRANATVLSRLTGAEPSRIREAARTAGSSEELPPAAEHAVELAGALRIPSPLPFGEAARQSGALTVEH